MNMQRKATLIVATVALAFGAGHFVQKRAAARMAEQPMLSPVTAVTPVAAGPVVDLPLAAAQREPVAPKEIVVPNVAAATVTAPPVDIVSVPSEEPVGTDQAEIAPVQPAPVVAAEEPAPDCSVKLELVPQPGAMIGISLLAPCNPEERVVLRHAGLAVTARTSSGGSVLTAIPAMKVDATVEALFPSRERSVAMISVPEFASMRRFAVQWQADDAFQLHAFEGGAGYGDEGHYSAAYTGKPGTGGFISILGDANTDLPLLAEVFTFAPGKDAEVVLEAAIDAETCGREILGETLLSEGGKVVVTDLTLAVPECDAAGDILVLKNLVPDMTLAFAR